MSAVSDNDIERMIGRLIVAVEGKTADSIITMLQSLRDERRRLKSDHDALAEAAEYIERLEDRLFAAGAMEQAPCFCCGYNGPGYYQPGSHPCAKRHHELRHGGGRMNDRSQTVTLTPDEAKKFERWVIENIDSSVVPGDEGNSEALVFNLVHAIRGDGEEYDYSAHQDDEIKSWGLRRP